MKKKKLPTGAKLTKKLDDAIRKLYHLKYPHPTCYVCGNDHGWYHPKTNKRGCQIGHYVSRRYFALRWDTKNIFPQGSGCNVVHNRNPLPFTQAILKEFGQERLDYLEAKCKAYTKLTTLQKREILKDLEKQISLFTNSV